MTDTLTPPSVESAVLESVPRGFLAHDWQPATGGRTFEVRNPATEEVIATVADCGAQDALKALDAAAAAADQWALTSPRDRAMVLHRITDAMAEHRERLARVITLEIGKTITEARGEVDYAAAYFRWYAEEAVRPHARSTPSPDGKSHIVTVAEPVGPCLLITPWNVPLAMAARKAAAALAAGCTAVLKPAALTPLSSLILGELARDLDARMLAQPSFQRVGGAVGQHVDPLMGLGVDHHAGIAVPPAQSKSRRRRSRQASARWATGCAAGRAGPCGEQTRREYRQQTRSRPARQLLHHSLDLPGQTGCASLGGRENGIPAAGASTAATRVRPNTFSPSLVSPSR
ncbi:hypothetical protein GCM10022233_87170 [Streptomyces shaanxiensis]|uniref:Aldehyde dehydrogenase domain-containing protein n=1 Tax=Streptomyces shaanxiensis TaxID=653357 RepID=A0ABP7WJS5_9ACTN